MIRRAPSCRARRTRFRCARRGPAPPTPARPPRTARGAARPTAGVLRVAPEAGEAITTSSNWRRARGPRRSCRSRTRFRGRGRRRGDTTVLKTGSLAAALAAALPEGALALRAWDAACAWAGGGLRNPRAGAAADRTAARRAGGRRTASARRATPSRRRRRRRRRAASTRRSGWRWRRPPRRRARGPLPGRGRGGGLAGERNAAAPAARRRRGRRAFYALLGALAARGMADAPATASRSSPRRARPVRATAGGAAAADRARLALGQARNPVARPAGDGDGGERARQQRGRPRERRRGRAGVGPVRGRREAAPRRDGRGRGRRGRRRRHRDGARRGRCRRRGARGRRVGRPRHRRGEGVGERGARRGGAAAEYTSPDGPFVVALSALDGAGYHAAPVAAAKTLRFSARGGGRRAAAPRERNVGQRDARRARRGRARGGGDGRGRQRDRVLPLELRGARLRHLPGGQLHRGVRGDRVGASSGCFAASSCGRPRRLGRRRVGPGRVRGGPGAVDGERDGVRLRAARGRRRARLPTATTARSFAKAYLRNLVGPVDPEKSAVILGFLGVIVFASALAAICGHRLDKRDASFGADGGSCSRTRRPFCWAPRPATSRRPWGQAGDARRRAALDSPPGSRPRTRRTTRKPPPRGRARRRLARGGLARAASVHFSEAPSSRRRRARRWRHYADALARQHPLTTVWRRDCKDQQPRAARIIALAGQIVMLMAAVAPRCGWSTRTRGATSESRTGNV